MTYQAWPYWRNKEEAGGLQRTLNLQLLYREYKLSLHSRSSKTRMPTRLVIDVNKLYVEMVDCQFPFLHVISRCYLSTELDDDIGLRVLRAMTRLHGPKPRWRTLPLLRTKYKQCKHLVFVQYKSCPPAYRFKVYREESNKFEVRKPTCI